jgi:hypothetical protein
VIPNLAYNGGAQIGTLAVNVTNTVQSWVNGSLANNGWALYSDSTYMGIGGWNADPYNITSAGAAQSPMLTITYSSSTTGSSSPTIANSSFETPSVGAGGYQYNPTGGSWTFSSNSGIQANGSAWGAATAPSGVQTAFLQGGGGLGSISQSVTFSAGAYTMSFDAAMRSGQTQPIKVSVDGTSVGTYTPSSNNFGLITTAPFTVSAGSHTITLAATDSTGDKSSFVDAVSISVH